MLGVWAPLALVVVAGFLVAYRYVGSPPPRAIRIATGAADGAYHAFAERYRRLLAEDGITLEVIPTAGTLENLERLRRGDVELALVQGGCATPDDRAALQSLGGLFLEPVWVFVPRSSPVAGPLPLDVVSGRVLRCHIQPATPNRASPSAPRRIRLQPLDLVGDSSSR